MKSIYTILLGIALCVGGLSLMGCGNCDPVVNGACCPCCNGGECTCEAGSCTCADCKCENCGGK